MKNPSSISGLVNYWAMTSNFNDSVGSLNLSTYGTGTATISNGSVYLDGNVGLKTSTNYSFSSNFTFGLSIKNIIVPGGSPIIGIMGVGTGQAYFGSTYMGITAYLNNTTIGVINGVSDADQKNFTINSSDWIDLIVRYNGTNFECFLNGVQATTVAGRSTKSYPLTIGGMYNSPANSSGVNWGFINGYIKDVVVYNRALSNQEIKNLTSGFSLKTSLSDMAIGDYISCEYTASSNTAGTFTNLGSATKAEIPTTGTTTPNGTFYFIKADKGTLIADRVIQTGVSWGTLNGEGYIQGADFNDMSYYLFENSLLDEGKYNRNLTGNNISSNYVSGKNGIGINSKGANNQSGYNSGSAIGNSYFYSNILRNPYYFTIGGWYKINPSTVISVKYCNYVGAISGTTGGGIQAGYGVTTTGYYGFLYSTNTSPYYYEVASTILATNNFVHLALKNNNQTYTLYVNGVPAVTHTVTGAADSTSLNFYSTYYNFNSALYYRAIQSVDDEVFISKNLLKDEEILSIYNNGITSFYNGTNNNISVRSLTGGTSYLSESGFYSTTNKNLGCHPSNNEWDKYILKSTLTGKITAGSNSIWNYLSGSTYYSNWTQDTPHSTIGASSTRIARPHTTANGLLAQASTTTTSGLSGFRPLLEYTE